MYLTLIAASLAGAVGFGSAWQLQAHTITKINLDAANDRISTQRAARTQAERRTTQIAAAQDNATSRAVVLRANVRSADAAAERLRKSAEAAMRTAAADLDTCNAVVVAHGAVLAESSGFIQEVVRDIDQCFSDKKLIEEAWPK